MQNIEETPAVQRLFLPNLYFRDDIVPPLPRPGPNIGNPLGHFPLPNPPLNLGGHLDPLPAEITVGQCFSPLPIRTAEDSHTATASHIQRMGLGNNVGIYGHRLRWLKRSDVLWDNLASYTEPDGVFYTPPQQQGQPIPQPMRVHTWQWTGGGAAHPTGNRQAEVIAKRLVPWFIDRSQVGELSMASEPDVHSVVHNMTITGLNEILKTRYQSQALALNEQGIGAWDPGHLPSDIFNGVFFPKWSYPTIKSHIIQEGSTNVLRGRAGIPDFLLRWNPFPNGAVAGQELKTGWACTREELSDMYNQDFAPDGSYLDAWRGKSVANKLLKQIWGQLRFFNITWCIVTNAKQVFLAAKTDLDELTITPMKEYSDPVLMRAFSGLCFAAVDMKTGRNDVNLLDVLCPPHTRVAPHAPQQA
ncbi:hypothetical protein OF83DRAFT_193621 [Amylostereum chailletii]|nr:hypothetical protein OF83DRAFT_193621 [Amylostereum chailletii]